MIIEAITAFTSVKIVWESLEIFHMAHVGHLTGKAVYKGGGSIIKRAIQHQQIKWQDKQYPALKLERETETLYDFEVHLTNRQRFSLHNDQPVMLNAAAGCRYINIFLINITMNCQAIAARLRSVV